MLKDALSKAFGGVAISVSSEVALIWREYERSSTTIADAYVKPIITDFTSSLVSDLREAGVEAPISLMKSNGGQTPVEQAAGHSAALILSGLAGGLVAGKYYADLVGRPDVVTLDMGGTSADVGVIHKGSISYRESYDIEWAIPVVGSFIDITSIGAGGSSIAAFDRGGFLKVGPESAAADPGPASYGHGGEEPTVTDANLVLGRLDPDFFLGGEMPLRPELARTAVEKIARRLDSSVEDAALAIVRLANENMANAVRLLTVDRGFDHRAFDLLAFGGAGPLHAADLASSLGMRRVLVPLHPGITSAFGTMVASPRVDRRWTRAQNTETVSTSDLNEAFSWLVTDAVEELHREGYQGPVEALRTVSMRYLGQNYEQEIPVPEGEIDDSTVATLVERYHDQHEAFYGYAMRENVCELAHFNVTAIGHVKPPSLPLLSEQTEVHPIAERLVYFRDTGWSTSAIYRRESLGSGTRITGPAVVQELDSTTVVNPRQVLTVEEHGVMFLEV
jgi:N-methylhydantoinase A